MTSALRPGTEVEYYSTSLGQWIPAKVHGAGQTPGTYDLDCKEGVDAGRIRPPSGHEQQYAPAPRSGGGRGGHPGGSPGLAEGDSCFYQSTTHGWITAQVARFCPGENTYDLDVKQQVPAESIFAVRDGEAIEYHSASSDSWIIARVLQRCKAPGTFNLDCKEGVHISRLRPPACASGGGGKGAPRRGGGYNPGLSAISESSAAAPTGYASAAPFHSDGQRHEKLDQLKRATRSENPAELQRRLESTSALGLVGEEALDQAGHKLWTLQARPGALAELRKATSGGNRTALEAAVDAAEAVGVPDCDIEAARQALQRLSLAPLWQYDAGDGHHIDVRAKPDIDGPRVPKRLDCGDVFCVSCESPGPNGMVYLQLADGRGWLFDQKPGVGIMCRRFPYTETDSPGPYVIIHDQTAVTATEAIGASEAVRDRLEAGAIVRVAQVVQNAAARRVRGRLEGTSGWISLQDTESGVRWAIKQQQRAAQHGGGRPRDM